MVARLGVEQAVRVANAKSAECKRTRERPTDPRNAGRRGDYWRGDAFRDTHAPCSLRTMSQPQSSSFFGTRSTSMRLSRSSVPWDFPCTRNRLSPLVSEHIDLLDRYALQCRTRCALPWPVTPESVGGPFAFSTELPAAAAAPFVPENPPCESASGV